MKKNLKIPLTEDLLVEYSIKPSSTNVKKLKKVLESGILSFED